MTPRGRSARGQWVKPHQRGFTLIEILVVIVLIGIITSMAVINIGGQDDTEEREARRLAAVLETASREAVIEARELGLILHDGGYRFTRLEQGEWRSDAFSQDRALRRHEFAEGIRLEVSTEGLPGSREPGEDNDNGDDDNDNGRPHILILSSGELTPFEIEVRRPASRRPSWFVTGDLDGSITFFKEGQGDDET